MKPTLTLKSILSLIHKDVRLIKQKSSKSPLDAETALTLSRYASTLSSVIQGGWKEKEKAKKVFEKKNTEELVRILVQEKRELVLKLLGEEQGDKT